MNKARREEIARLITEAEELKGMIESIREEEQEYYDNMPESLQQGERGQNAESAVSELEDAIDAMDNVICSLGSIE